MRIIFTIFCLLLAVQSRAATIDVTSHGAVGDAIQFYAHTTSNSVVVVTTNTFSGADIGKSIQVFDAGTVTTAPECQDLVATITNVVNGTNLHVSFVAQRTLTNTFCTVGTDNRSAFQAAVDAATGSDTIINIPAGTYFISAQHEASLSGNAGVRIHKGGLRFVGEGTNETVLLSQGAWKREPNRDNLAWRGFLFAIVPPVTNDFPLTFENLTMNGGVPDGRTGNHNFPASATTGDGWDETHGAIVVRGGGWQAPTATQQTWTNVLFRHWRGEMVKSNDGSTNGNLNAFNCTFFDGNATAINYYASQNISNCVFSQMHQVGEFYQAYNTNTSYLQHCLMTNISINSWAFNGAKSNSPTYIVHSNTWYLASGGYNGIMTTPGVNITIQSNNFIGLGGGTFAITLGAAGYQGTYFNSNIVVQGNSFSGCDQIIQISGATDSTGVNRVENVRVFENTISGSSIMLMAYNWSRDVYFYSNTVPLAVNQTDGKRRAFFSSGAYGSDYALVDVNNLYYAPVYNIDGTTNYLYYGGGSNYEIVYPFAAGGRYVLSTSDASYIPVGAKMLIQNNNLSSATVPVYLDSAQTLGPVNIAFGEEQIFHWYDGVWNEDEYVPPTRIGRAQSVFVRGQ